MEMQDNKLKRFTVYGKIANALFIITVVFGTLMVLVGLGLAIYLNVADFDITEAVNFVFDNELPGSKLILPDTLEVSYGAAYIIVINIAVMFTTVAFVFKAVSNMFKHTAKKRTPFTQNTVRCVKNIGFAMLIYAAVVFVLSIITSLITPFSGFTVNIEWSMVLIGLLVTALGEMFEFGMNLQEDNASIV